MLGGCASSSAESDGIASDDLTAPACRLDVAGVTTPLQRGSDGVVYFTPSKIAIRKLAVASVFLDPTEQVAGATRSPYGDRIIVTTDAVPVAAESLDTITAAVHKTLPSAVVRSLPLTTTSAKLDVNALAGEATETEAQASDDGSIRFVTHTLTATAAAISNGIGIAGVTAGVGAAPGCGAAAPLTTTAGSLALPATLAHTNDGEVATKAFHIVLYARTIPAGSRGEVAAAPAAYETMVKALETTATLLFPYAAYDASWSADRVRKISASLPEAVLAYAKAFYLTRGTAVPADLETHRGTFEESSISELYVQAKSLAGWSARETNEKL